MTSMTGTSSMRDSSLDYRTYWLRDGLYFGKSRFLGDDAVQLPADKLSLIPDDDRKILLDETEADPAFLKKVASIMARDPNWAHTLSDSAKAAAANEIDPSKGARGGWPRLRARVRDLLVGVAQQAILAARQLTPEQRFGEVKRLAASAVQVRPPSVHGLGNLGQWDVIGSLVGNMASLGAGIYGATVTADAQKDVAKIQADAAMQNAQAQIAMANASNAITVAQNAISPIANALSTLSTSTIAGVPILIPVVGLIGLGLYLAFGRK